MRHRPASALIARTPCLRERRAGDEWLAVFHHSKSPFPSLNGGYTIFGQCDDAAVTLVKKIARMKRDGRDFPASPVKITHIEIHEAGAASAKPAAKSDGNETGGVNGSRD